MADSRETIRNTRDNIAKIRSKAEDQIDNIKQSADDRVRELEDRIDTAMDKQRNQRRSQARDRQRTMGEWVIEQVIIHEEDKKPLITWMDRLEVELKKLKSNYRKVKPTDALELYYAKMSPRDAAKKLVTKKEYYKESFNLFESQKNEVLAGLRSQMDGDWYKALKVSNNMQALDKMVMRELRNGNVAETVDNLMNRLGRTPEEYMEIKNGALHDKDLMEAYSPKQKEAIEKVKQVLFRDNKVGFYTASGKIMVSPKDEAKAKQILDKAFGGNFTKATGMMVKKSIGPKKDFKINAGYGSMDEAKEYVLMFDFHSPDYTSKEGRAIQDDLNKKFKKTYSGSGSGGSGWDASFNGSKQELQKAKKYVETKYKNHIASSDMVIDESVEEASFADRQVVRHRGPKSDIKKSTGIKLVLPDTPAMKKKMDAVMKKDPATRRKMDKLVIDREKRGNELVLQFNSTRARDSFRKLMNDSKIYEGKEEDFEPHMMYHPKTGKGYKANTYQDHVRMGKMGYKHEKPELEEMSAKAHYKKFKNKGKVSPIDREKYPNREKQGLEGPYRVKKTGQIYYYDKKAGKYYDTDTDMYLQVSDIMESFELVEATNTRVVIDLNDAGNRARTLYRKMESEIAGLDGYKESEFDRAKNMAIFHFDAKKHDGAERKKVAEVIKKTKGAEFHHSMTEAQLPQELRGCDPKTDKACADKLRTILGLDDDEKIPTAGPESGPVRPKPGRGISKPGAVQAMGQQMGALGKIMTTEAKKGREKGSFTAVAIEVNKKYPKGKYAGQLANVEKSEWKEVAKFLQAEHGRKDSKINVAIEDHNGKVVKVFKEETKQFVDWFIQED